MLFNCDKGFKRGPNSEWIVLSAFSSMSSDFLYQLSFLLQSYCNVCVCGGRGIVSSHPNVYSIQLYVIKIVSDLW